MIELIPGSTQCRQVQIKTATSRVDRYWLDTPASCKSQGGRCTRSLRLLVKVFALQAVTAAHIRDSVGIGTMDYLGRRHCRVFGTLTAGKLIQYISDLDELATGSQRMNLEVCSLQSIIAVA